MASSPDRPPSPRELEEALLGEELRYTRMQVIEKAGVSEEFSDRVWRALGFAQYPDDVVAFTEGDAIALERLRSLFDSGLTEDVLIRMARAAGHTLARLAEWQGDIFYSAFTEPDQPISPEMVTQLAQLATAYVDEFEPLIMHTWRRQLAASGTRALAIAETQDNVAPARIRLAVGFADLEAFTRISRSLDELGLARLVESFEAIAGDVIAEHGGRLVKTLGDEVLFSADSPRTIAEIALVMTERMAADDDVPRVRAGLAYGHVMPLMGDVFGTTVNLAARLTSIARPGTVLADAGLAASLESTGGYELIRLVRRPARGLGIIQPYVLRRLSV